MIRRSMVLLAGLMLMSGSPADERASAPDFALRTTEGSILRLSEYRGRGVVLAFWATRCAVCTPQVARLDELTARLLDRGVQLLVISIDRDPAAAAGLAAGLHAPVLLDPDRQVARLYRTGQLPFAVFIDADGRVRETAPGSRDWAANHERAVRALMDEWIAASGWDE